MTNERGVWINGTRYWVQIIQYNDGADCNTMLTLYEHLITVDNVHVLFAPTSYDCQAIGLLAAQYQIPYLNGADAQYQAVTTGNPLYENATWTFTLVPLDSSTINCFKVLMPYIDTFSMFESETGGSVTVPDYPQYVEAAINSTNGTIKLLSYDLIDLIAAEQSLSEFNDFEQNCSYFLTFINKWKSLDPKFLGGTASLYTDLLLQCMAYYDYHPPNMWHWVAISYPPDHEWLYTGSLIQDAWEPLANFSDPIFVDTQLFEQRLLAEFGIVASSYEAQQAITGSILVATIERIGSFNNFAIQAHFAEYNGSTLINGRTFFVPGTHETAQDRLCFQHFSPLKQNVVYPLNYLNVFPVVTPWNWTTNSTFLDLVAPPGDPNTRTRDLTLEIVFSILGALIIAGIIGFAIFRWKYYTVVIPKKDVAGGWEDN